MRWLVVSLLLCASVALAQASAVKIVDPSDQTKQANVKAVGSERALTVRCVEGCASTINLGDAGISITADSWFPDGGSIGYMRMPDGGPLEVYTVNAGGGGGGGWTPDGGSIGSVVQGSAADGGLDWSVRTHGVVSTVNATTTPLGSGATYTGTWEEVTDFPFLTISVYANVASATDGFKVQWSLDGSNMDSEVPLTIAAAAGRSLATATRNRYVRLVYTNGGSAQGTFRLGLVKHQTAGGLNNYPIDTPIISDAWGILTRSVITGETTAGGGGFVNVKVNPSGTLAVAASQDTSPWVVSAASLPLPTGAATAANQTTLGSQTTKLNDGTDTALITGAGALTVDGSGVTQPVSAASLPLPTGASTSALQTTGNTSLSNIDTKTPALGQTTMAGSSPVVIASNQSAVPASQSGTWSTRTQDGAGNALASSTTAPAGSEQALIVRNIPSGTQTVSGSVTASGTVTANQGTPAATANRWPTQITDGTDLAQVSASGALLVDGSATTQPVSGTVTANAGTGNFAVNQTQVNGVAVSTGNGVAGTGVQRVTIASDNTAFTVNAAQSGTWNINNVSGTVSLPTGAATETTLGTRLSESVFTGRFPASATLADATANPSLSASAGYLMAYNGTTWDRLRKSATGLLVDIQNTSLAVTQAGTWNVGLSAGTNYIGKTRITDGTLDMSLLNSAPGSDTGQVSVPVRIISSLAGGAGGTSSSFGATFPATGTAAGFSDGTNMQTGRVFDLDTGGGSQYVLGTNLRVSASGGSVEAAAGSGTVNANTLRVVLPTDQPVIPVSDNGSSLTVDGTVAISNSFLLDATFTGRFSLGAAATDNFANPTTTGTLGFNMLWDGATWDRAPGNSTDGTLVNLGANNDVTVTGTVTANAGTGTFTVGQATAANLRAQTASESTTNTALPTVASAAGFSDGTNLRIPRVVDVDTSGGGTIWATGVSVLGGGFGAPTQANVEEVVPTTTGATGLYVWSIAKDVTNPVTTSVSCATTATAAPASILTNRTTLTVINNSTATIYLGGSAVTTATGIPLLPGASFMDDVSNATYYCIVTSGTADLRVLEN